MAAALVDRRLQNQRSASAWLLHMVEHGDDAANAWLDSVDLSVIHKSRGKGGRKSSRTVRGAQAELVMPPLRAGVPRAARPSEQDVVAYEEAPMVELPLDGDAEQLVGEMMGQVDQEEEEELDSWWDANVRQG